MSIPICTRCKQRPAREKVESFDIRIGAEHVHWCPICYAAHRIVFTSADEAVKYGIKGETRREVLVEAMKLEKERGGYRLTVIKAIERRMRAVERETRNPKPETTEAP